ncbi:VOC family protein [Iodidimonas sp. SYSU 1G8]|uniref:VOC family protein n=1 Tax=Iodidimonas sp. SYSU 1G8 TaxID=3133967 RepID=UPI0031FF3394
MTIPVVFHHVGITVSNLERSVQWYREVFGLEPAFALEVSGPSADRNLRLPPHVHRAVLIPVGNFAIELLEFIPARRPMDQRQDDVGYVYLCFVVDDIEDVYARLTAMGHDFHTEPVYAGDEGQIAGSKFCIMRDPDGKTIEFVQPGPGMQVAALHVAAARKDVDLARPQIFKD